MRYGRYQLHMSSTGQTIEAGYLIEDICHDPECEEKIDRGLSFLCGQFPGGDEYGCGWYFCDSHLFYNCEPAFQELADVQLCGPCIATYKKERR